MKSPTSSHQVLKSLGELSSELLKADTVAREKTEPEQTRVPMQQTKHETIQAGNPIVFDARGQRGWGIND